MKPCEYVYCAYDCIRVLWCSGVDFLFLSLQKPRTIKKYQSQKSHWLGKQKFERPSDLFRLLFWWWCFTFPLFLSIIVNTTERLAIGSLGRESSQKAMFEDRQSPYSQSIGHNLVRSSENLRKSLDVGMKWHVTSIKGSGQICAAKRGAIMNLQNRVNARHCKATRLLDQAFQQLSCELWLPSKSEASFLFQSWKTSLKNVKTPICCSLQLGSSMKPIWEFGRFSLQQRRRERIKSSRSSPQSFDAKWTKTCKIQVSWQNRLGFNTWAGHVQNWFSQMC